MVSKDQIVGIGILFGCLVGLAVYFWLVFLSMWSIFILKLTVFVAATLVLGIATWIGWVMATTSSPQPIEGITSKVTSESKTEEQKSE